MHVHVRPINPILQYSTVQKNGKKKDPQNPPLLFPNYNNAYITSTLKEHVMYTLI